MANGAEVLFPANLNLAGILLSIRLAKVKFTLWPSMPARLSLGSLVNAIVGGLMGWLSMYAWQVIYDWIRSSQALPHGAACAFGDFLSTIITATCLACHQDQRAGPTTGSHAGPDGRAAEGSIK